MDATALVEAFTRSLTQWMDEIMVEYAKITEESTEPETLRYRLCAHWLKAIEEVLHPDAPKLLQLLTDHAMHNIDAWMEAEVVDSAMIGHISQLLLGWPKLILRSLSQPDDVSANNELLAFLLADCWPVPFDEQQLLALTDALEQYGSTIQSAQKDEAVAFDEQNAELIEGFCEALSSSCGELGSAAELLAVPGSDTHILFKFRDAWQDLLPDIMEMCRMFSLDELQHCCQQWGERLATMQVRSAASAELWSERLDGWTMLFDEVLQSFRQGQGCQPEALRSFMDDAIIWQDEEASKAQPSVVASKPEVVSISADDLALQPDHDVHPAVLGEFLQEAEEHASAFSTTIQQLAHASPQRPMLEKAQRIAHTLKGAANTTGYRGIANIAHHSEDLLEYLYQHDVPASASLLELLMEVADTLEVMIEYIQGRGDYPEHALALLQRLMTTHRNMITQGADAAPLPIASTAVPAQEQAQPEAVPPPMETTTKPSEHQESLKVSRQDVDELLRQVGEITIAMGQMQNRFDQLKTQLLAHYQIGQQAYQHGLAVEDLLVTQRIGLAGIAEQQHNVENENFDPLEMDQYNELHSGVNRLLEAIADGQTLSDTLRNDMESLDVLLLNQQRLHRFLQENILQTRMAPFSSLEMRLQRIVRQTARKTEKDVQLLCHGMEQLVDSEVLNTIADPLMHILRNAVDHGIETAQERLQKGKPAQGLIQLDVSQLGYDICIRCQDDGQGLDFAAIRQTAEQKGLITAQQELNEEELARLTLQPGFSTRNEATQISGRGFGMDIAMQIISRLKGRIQLLPIADGGLMIEIHLPVTLVTMHALLIESQQQTYAIPSRDIIRVLNRGDGVVKTVAKKLVFELDETIYPLFSLNAMLWGNHEPPDVSEIEHSVPLLVRSDEKLQVLLVEKTMACQELVMKHEGRFTPKIHGVSGLSILSDSRVASVLSLTELLHRKQGNTAASFAIKDEQQHYINEKSRETTVMIVDDSLSVRRTLSSLMQDLGYKTLLAIDGIEAISILETHMPDIMLLDLELPRMNGLELCSYLRKQEASKDLPIIMITSRATQKHRDRAKQAGINHYMVKPYQEDDLLHHIERLLEASA